MKEGFTDRDIEQIWKFYSDVLKNRELSDILAEIEVFYAKCLSAEESQKKNEFYRSDVTLKFDPINPVENSSSPKYGTASLSLV